MAMKDDLARQEKVIEQQEERIDSLKEKISNLEYELNHYRKAVSAVKWLWDQAAKQPEFQI